MARKRKLPIPASELLAGRNQEAIAEIDAAVGTSKVGFEFVKNLAEFFNPTEIVLILRAARAAGLQYKE